MFPNVVVTWRLNKQSLSFKYLMKIQDNNWSEARLLKSPIWCICPFSQIFLMCMQYRHLGLPSELLSCQNRELNSYDTFFPWLTLISWLQLLRIILIFQLLTKNLFICSNAFKNMNQADNLATILPPSSCFTDVCSSTQVLLEKYRGTEGQPVSKN